MVGKIRSLGLQGVGRAVSAHRDDDIVPRVLTRHAQGITLRRGEHHIVGAAVLHPIGDDGQVVLALAVLGSGVDDEEDPIHAFPCSLVQAVLSFTLAISWGRKRLCKDNM